MPRCCFVQEPFALTQFSTNLRFSAGTGGSPQQGKTHVWYKSSPVLPCHLNTWNDVYLCSSKVFWRALKPNCLELKMLTHQKVWLSNGEVPDVLIVRTGIRNNALEVRLAKAGWICYVVLCHPHFLFKFTKGNQKHKWSSKFNLWNNDGHKTLRWTRSNTETLPKNCHSCETLILVLPSLLERSCFEACSEGYTHPTCDPFPLCPLRWSGLFSLCEVPLGRSTMW